MWGPGRGAKDQGSGEGERRTRRQGKSGDKNVYLKTSQKI